MGREILPIKTGVDPVNQLAGRISRKMATRSDFKLAGFVCPFYEIDESKLENGFGAAITGVSLGDLNDFPRYRKKFDKLLKLTNTLNTIFGGKIDLSLDIIMGDTGVINAERLKLKDSEEVIGKNLEAYKRYMKNKGLDLKNIETRFINFSQMTGSYGDLGEFLSDLVTDGMKLHNGSVSFDINNDVSRKVAHEQIEASRKGVSIYESAGFMFNYGLAGIVLKSLDTDILIGTDPPGSYMNYLYHSFIRPDDLLVVVPK